jgi:hypothetical protein
LLFVFNAFLPEKFVGGVASPSFLLFPKSVKERSDEVNHLHVHCFGAGNACDVGSEDEVAGR